jgi:hypothetical protein
VEWIAAASGVVLIWAALNDVFHAVVVPRPTPSRYRPSAVAIRITWPLWRGQLMGDGGKRERRLGSYAPFATIGLLGMWIAMLIAGNGLVFYAIRDQLDPAPPDIATATYFAATALLTIGFGDIVPTGTLARALAATAGVTGLAVVALTITYLFTLYGSLERRELGVTTLDARAGAPPSGVTLLEESSRAGRIDELPALFEKWEGWSAHVLDSHLAHPLLAYFRSSHDGESWVSALGALLDAATLVITTIEDVPRGQAQVMRGIGSHVVEDLAQVFGLAYERDSGVERSEFDDAYRSLAAAGFRMRDADAAWADFSSTREQYAAGLNALARHFAVPPALWISDRTVLPHRPTGRS